MASTDYMELIQKHMSQQELFSVAQALNSAYYPFLQDIEVWHMLDRLFPEPMKPHLNDLKGVIGGHEVVSGLIENFYPGEKLLKYYLANRYIERANEVSAFEVKIGDSRLDFARINGHSYAFEIKTELDTLDKLAKQVMDYASCFEYVIVVMHRSHLDKAKKILPPFCGIQSYRMTNTGCKFNFAQKKEKSPVLSMEKQLGTLTSNELSRILKSKGISDIPQRREERECMIRNISSGKQTNTFFKNALKERFRKRWMYLQDIFPEVLPIDIQTFFNTQADPKWVYQRDSFIVNR